MNSQWPVQQIPTAPPSYDQSYMNQLVRAIEATLERARSPGAIEGQKMNLNNLTTSTTGLRAGDLWNDSGVVRVAGSGGAGIYTTIATIAALRAVTSSLTDTHVYVTEWNSGTLRGGGVFYRDGTTGGTDDQGFLIVDASGRNWKRLYDTVDVTMFGAKDDGVTDDAAAIQAAIDAVNLTGGELYFPTGTFAIGTALKMKSNVALRGAGYGVTTIKAMASLSQSAALVETASLSGGTNVYAQSNIAIDGITFDGNSANRTLTTFIFLVRLHSVDGLRISNVRFQNHEYGLLAMGGSRNISLSALKFTNWGRPAVSTEGGPGLWLAGNPVGGDDTPTSRVRGTDLDFSGAEWVPIYDFSTDSEFSNINIYTVKEGGVFTQLNSPDGLSDRHIYTGFNIKGVRRKNISAAGFEVYGQNTIITAFNISDTDDAGIKINSKTENLTISDGNIWDTVKQQATYADYLNYGQITANQASGDTNKNITIHDVRIGRSDVVPIAKHAIALFAPGPEYYLNLQFTGINPSNGYTTAFLHQSSNPLNPADTTSRIMDNLGVADSLNPNSGLYTPTLTNVINLDASTAYECQWSRVGNTVTVSGRVDVDPTALVATRLGISLPVASDFAAGRDCAGTASAHTVSQSAGIFGDITNNRAQMEWIATNAGSVAMHFIFCYRVI